MGALLTLRPPARRADIQITVTSPPGAGTTDVVVTTTKGISATGSRPRLGPIVQEPDLRFGPAERYRRGLWSDSPLAAIAVRVSGPALAELPSVDRTALGEAHLAGRDYPNTGG